MTNQAWRMAPITTLGKWSVVLIIAMPLLFFVGSSFTNLLYSNVASGNTIIEDITARPGLALTMLAGMAAGIFAFLTGVLAIARKQEKALLVYASSIIGALLIVFLVGEIVLPH